MRLRVARVFFPLFLSRNFFPTVYRLGVPSDPPFRICCRTFLFSSGFFRPLCQGAIICNHSVFHHAFYPSLSTLQSLWTTIGTPKYLAKRLKSSVFFGRFFPPLWNPSIATIPFLLTARRRHSGTTQPLQFRRAGFVQFAFGSVLPLFILPSLLIKFPHVTSPSCPKSSSSFYSNAVLPNDFFVKYLFRISAHLARKPPPGLFTRIC